MRLSGEFTLHVVEGGLSPDPQPVESTLEDRVQAVLDDIGAEIEDWEAVAHVARLEEFLGRECDEREIEDHVSMVMCVKAERDLLGKVLAGAAYCYAGAGREFFAKDNPLTDEYRKNYERHVAKNRAIREEARRRLG